MAGEIIQGGDIAPGQGTNDEPVEDAAETDVDEQAKPKVRRTIDISGDDKLRVLVIYVETADEASTDPEAIPTSFGITLTTSGGLITGTLVPARWWAKQQLALVAGSHEPTAEAFRGMFAALDERRDADEALEDRNYIHLVDAHHVVGGTFIPTGPGYCWRGMLSQVAGWSIGNLATS
jgi:hypothetical protein